MREWNSSSSPINRGAISSRARQPSMSAALMGERVRKYLAMFFTPNHLPRNSWPSSSAHQASVSVLRGQTGAAGWVVGSLSRFVGSGCLARNGLMLSGAADGVSLDVTAWVALDSAPLRAQYSA